MRRSKRLLGLASRVQVSLFWHPGHSRRCREGLVIFPRSYIPSCTVIIIIIAIFIAVYPSSPLVEINGLLGSNAGLFLKHCFIS